MIGPTYGGAVATDAATGQLVGFPNVAGSVKAIVSDGAGGWFLGGDFAFVGGVARTNLAQIDSSHAVTAWNPVAGGIVTSLLASDTTVYFVISIPAGNSALYKADRSIAAVTKFVETTNGAMSALAIVGNRLYVGGEFRMLLRNSTFVETPGAAALDAVSGEIIAEWHAGSDANGQHTIEAIAANDSLVFVGGYFNHFGGQNRYSIAALEASTGNAIPWYSEDLLSTFRVRAIVLRDSTLFVGGSFSRLGSQVRQRIAALDIKTGLARDWNPGVPGECSKLSMAGSTLYAAGEFPPVAFDLVTGEARDWHPTPSLSGYSTIAATDSVVYVGAGLNTIGASNRGHIAALDAATGVISPWSAVIEGTVYATAVAGPIVYVGGDFRRINGVVRNHVAALDSATGEPTAWDPDADNTVEAILVSGNTVYLGGDFTQIQGQPRSRIAAVDATTGALLPWDPGADATVHALAVADSIVYVGGNFTVAGGQPRSKLAAIDSATGTPTAWDPAPNNDVYAIAIRGTSLYASGRFSRVGASKRGRMSAIDLVSGAPSAFDPQANGPVRSFVISGSTIYMGGEFDLIGLEPRSRIAAIDVDTGAPRSWNPGLNGTIRAVAFGENVVFAGGDFVYNGNLPRSYLAVVPDEHTTATLVTLFQLEIGTDGVVIRWQLAGDDASTRCRIERAGTHDGPWAQLAASVEREGLAWTTTDRDIVSGHTYWYRLAFEDAGRTWASSPIEATAFEPVAAVALSRIAPTPSHGPVTIAFDIPRESDVTITILDVQGRVTARIADGRRTAGRYQIAWSGTGPGGPLPSGIYFVRLEAAGRSVFRRFVLAR
jgi:hypothetical protein